MMLFNGYTVFLVLLILSHKLVLLFFGIVSMSMWFLDGMA